MTTVQACTHEYYHDYVVTWLIHEIHIFQHGFRIYGRAAW